jgi:hypothetical protein
MSDTDRPATLEECERALNGPLADRYPTETAYCIGRPGQMRAVPAQDGERLVAAGYIRPAPEVDPPRRWFVLADGVTQAMLDATMRQMVDDHPRRLAPRGDGFELLFDPPTDSPARDDTEVTRRD